MSLFASVRARWLLWLSPKLQPIDGTPQLGREALVAPMWSGCPLSKLLKFGRLAALLCCMHGKLPRPEDEEGILKKVKISCSYFQVAKVWLWTRNWKRECGVMLQFPRNSCKLRVNVISHQEVQASCSWLSGLLGAWRTELKRETSQRSLQELL